MRPTSPVTVAAGSLLAVVAAVGLAGCGSGSSSPSSTAPTAPAPSSSVSSSATAPATPSKTPSAVASSSTPSAPAATEFNPPGDIPDDAVFVDHTARGTHVHFSVPEGWAQTRSGPVTTYTDKYNSVSIEVRQQSKPSTVASAKAHDVPKLQATVSSFQLKDVAPTTRQHGSGIEITYLLDSPPNQVTGKVVRDAVERFQFWHAGEEAILSLTGPENADNVDPWQIVSDSLQWK